ncbi:hypothetical protein [Paenibacillus protaetiae]|uniref:DUF4352 domain-containing protein n=1 Tax=Paenibacillus protaetiae TaxID=2509456 RepID=A0A4P6EVR2_9BACL|nr:hypothetical protein [Paenibacillus protaetiae]QAY65779.1 hypothetical protein ET464_04675 [Paenibacillus protaetiae]
MNKVKKGLWVAAACCALLLISACGAANEGKSGNAGASPAETSQTQEGSGSTASANPDDTAEGQAASGGTEASAAPEDDAASAAPSGTSSEILIIIDQTPKPIEGNSFDFTVNKRPDGYALSEMQWISETTTIVNTTAEAVQHGQNGEDGFYISGDGQFTGFFYPDSMKGEKGEVVFVFKNSDNQELTWKKTITLM